MSPEIGGQLSQQLPQFHSHQYHHHLPSACDRHPDQQHFTGFCPSCLRERLTGLHPSAASSSSFALRRNSTSSLKSVFSRPHSSTSTSTSLDLRRCKSFSAAAAFEAQRKSCDVRHRNTLCSLFHQDDKLDSVEIVRGRNLGLGPPSSSTAAALVMEAIGTSGEIDGGQEAADLRPMREHIDLECRTKGPPPSKDRSGFWLLSRKLQKWRRNQKGRHHPKPHSAASNPPESSCRFRDTQSAIAVDAFGRRSCDYIDPRFSLDAGRISFDDPRLSLDEPRASWDGYLVGSSLSVFPRLPPILSVLEDVPTPVVQRSDGQTAVEAEDATNPGGTAQTRDYYYDSSSRHRRSLDRSTTFELNDLRPVSNAAKVSPAGGTDFFHLNYMRDDRSESFESGYRDPHNAKLGIPPQAKKSRNWRKGWNIWGFIHLRGSSRGGANVVERSHTGTSPESRATNGSDAKICRSNSSVSSRSSFSGNGGHGSMRRTGMETNGNGLGKKRREELVLERNQSARYSPRHFDNNGLLRFYLTPVRPNHRRKGEVGKNSHNSSYQSFTRSMLRIY